MSAERWQLIKEILNDALERDPADRESYLAVACGGDAELRREVDRLLALEDDSASFMGAVPSSLIPGDNEPSDELIGRRIGRYRVTRRIASGGMGVVFEAEQENPRRTVALKIVRPGLVTGSTLRRFEHEAHVLGSLQHPGIAQIYEAGTFDLGDGARPFFAMELVDGLPLIEYAERNRLGTRQRLELMIRICHAIQHAHQKGVVHRDLKPGNILVCEGTDARRQEGTVGERVVPPRPHAVEGRGGDHRIVAMPKILDFGVARVIDSDMQMTTMPRTLTGELIGTLHYMSPEQLAGDPREVDTRADVYALGVICFELLTGKLPFDTAGHTIVEIARTITEDDPARLGSINRSFRGDLDTIVDKALEKDKSRRYVTVSDLAADIERFLRDEPILARPPSRLYQLRKFVRRNRVLVGGGVATFIALAAGLVMYSLEARHATIQAASAQYEADKYRAVHDFIVNDLLFTILSAVGSEFPDHDDRIVGLIDAAAAQIETLFADQPLHASAVRNQVATMYYNLGRYNRAEEHFRASLETRQQLLGDDHRDTLNATNNLGLVEMRQGRIADAEVHYRAALEGRRRVLGEDHADTLVSMNNLAALLQRKGDLEEAERLLRLAIDVQRRVRGERHSDTLTSMSNLAGVLAARGDYEAAEAVHREAIESFEATLGAAHVTTLVATSRLARTLMQQDRLAEAETLFRRAADGLDQVLGDEHLHTLAVFDGLASVLVAQQKHGAAEPYARRAVIGFRASVGAGHPRSQAALARLIALYDALGNPEEAARWRALEDEPGALEPPGA